jgi:hypothetical protein
MSGYSIKKVKESSLDFVILLRHERLSLARGLPLAENCDQFCRRRRSIEPPTLEKSCSWPHLILRMRQVSS